MAHQELGRDIFVKIKQALLTVSKVERDAKMEGRRMTMVLQPDHKPAGAGQGGAKPAGAAGQVTGSTRPAGSTLNIPQRAVPASAPLSR